ncbi:MAG: hypothetical protein ACI36Y_02810 [Coriobacteriales bacterium]
MSRRDDNYSAPSGSSQRRSAQRPAGSQGRLSYEDQMRSRGQSAQRQRSVGSSARDYSRERYTGGQCQGARTQQPSGRRQVQLDQGAQLNRRPQQVPQYGANRYSRGNGVYQARPNQAANAARAAEGALSSPVSFLVRIVLVVVLAAVFGVRLFLSSGDIAQLRDLETTIASQQEQLDTLTAQNQSMQESIDSRQATLDAYNALL